MSVRAAWWLTNDGGPSRARRMARALPWLPMATRSSDDEGLQRALIGAVESPPDRRDRWVGPVAAAGVAGIDAVSEWVYDKDLAPFALEVILRAAELGAHDHALRVLRQIERRQLGQDRFLELVRTRDRVELSAGLEPSRAGSSRVPLRHLVAGEEYQRRAELHASGLGADIYKGISYARDGEHALLFSGGHGEPEFGYKDGWDGPFFLYCGEWRGDGDMQMTGGNRAVMDRSPHLDVFTGTRETWNRFEGRSE